MFRVKYSEALLQRLLPAIKNEALSAADRLGIQEDVSALAKAGQCSLYWLKQVSVLCTG